MKLKHKKTFLSGVAVTLAGVLGIGALLQSGISVQASPAMMPGIEQIIKDKGNTEPFRILEIVDNKKDAEIGWYVSGQEPYIKLYEYKVKDKDGKDVVIHFSSLEEGLSKLPSEQLRKEFANNVKWDESGNLIPDGGVVKDITSVCYQDGKQSTNPQEEYPLSYSGYTEKYFLSPDDNGSDWKRMDFVDLDGGNRIDKVSLHGQYVPNPSGTGDYTKQPQTYYPIRQNTKDSSNEQEKYRENIKDFFYSEGTGAAAPYHLEFTEVDNKTVNDIFSKDPVDSNNIAYKEYDYASGRYGYYEKVYADLTEELAETTEKYPGEQSEIAEEGVLISDNSPLSVSELFSAGDDNPFSSNEVQTDAAVEPQVIVEEPSVENAFSDGASAAVFSSETLGEEERFQEEELSSPEVDPAFSEASSETMVIPQCIYEPLGKDKAGTQSDPWVYLGEIIDQFPNYKYTLISDLETVKKMAAEKASEDETNKTNGNPISRKQGDISLENGQFFYWKENGGNIDKYPLSVVTGYQPVAYKDIRPVYEQLGYNYYFRVSKAYFCCKLPESASEKDPESYQYFGWYYPSYPQDEAQYLPVESHEVATHYISNAEYKLTEGLGDHDFVPGNGEGTKDWMVEVNHMFYKGGYINSDWFKRYVFNLKPEEEDFENLEIEVTTVLPTEFEEKYGDPTAQQTFTDEIPSAAGTEFTDNDVSLHAEIESTENALLMEDTTEEQNNPGEIELFSETETAPEEQTSETEELFTDTSEDFAFTAGEAEIQETDNSGTEFPALEQEDVSQVFISGAEGTQPVALKDFDLIYINGTLTVVSAETLEKSMVPCIINEKKLQTTENGQPELARAFSDFLKNEDADSHYVTKYIYVFKNTLSQSVDSGVPADRLLNLQLHQNFNDGGIGDGTTGTTGSQIQGFEEILSYIESENQYRQLGATQSEEKYVDNNGNNVEVGDYIDSNNNKIEFLETTLSQARAIEYILNYKHRRNTSPKDEINVLEIQPAKSNGQLKAKEILGWMGYTADEKKAPEITVNACCSYEKGGKILANMTDNKDDTIWHSFFGDPPEHSGNHYITIKYIEPSDFIGLKYLARSTGGKNGIVKKFTLIYYDTEDKILQTDSEVTWTGKDGNYDIYIPNNPIQGVKKIKLEVTQAETEIPGKNFASCAELKLETFDYFNCPKVNITTMTSSEYVGHIDDINSIYDIIYWGTDDKSLSNYENFRPEKYLYYHIGKEEPALGELQGLMYQDYVRYPDNLQTSKIEGEVGLVRGSGNDITPQQQNELMDFVQSGYPVILGNDLLTSSGTIDENKVDNSSYVYSFMKEAVKYANVISENEASQNKNLLFYMNIPKPTIEFENNGYPVSAIGNENGPSGNYLTGDGLAYIFQIKDDAVASPANAKYNCELYIDLNCDGNFSPLKEKIRDIQIREQDKVVSRNADGKYELQMGKIYTVTRTIPQDYVKLITWKLEISNTQNDYIRTSVQGYTKRKVGAATVPEIKVLQFHPDAKGEAGGGAYGDKGNTWDLTDQQFKEYFKVVDDEFKINIKEISVTNYNKNYNDNTGDLGNNEAEGYCNLNDYDMLIIGFGDGNSYGNINENGVNGIKKFIESGKSVIFAHDTTSSSVIDPNAIEANGVNIWKGWAYNFNMQMRSVMGMDRYGITGNQKSTFVESEKISGILKQANNISDSDVDTWSLLQNCVPDMAYKAGSNQKVTTAQTHGFTNGKLRIATLNRKEPEQQEQDKVTNVNEGAITEYPYKIDDENGFTVAKTHSQYYQTALEADTDMDGRNDIVVWYCLDGGRYAESPNDVRNNYYLYSNKNVYYTGVGHRLVQEKGSEQEKKLFVNTIVAAYRASTVKPQIEFVDSFYFDANEQETVYYMPDQDFFSIAPGNLLNENQEFYFRIKDNNLISTGVEEEGERKMNIELYISDSSGELVEGINEKVKKIQLKNTGNGDGGIVLYQKDVSETGTVVDQVSSGHVYRFELKNLYQYIMENQADGSLPDLKSNYKNNVNLYAKVSTKYMYFGEEISVFAVDNVNLCRRQLFDLD